MRLSLRTAGRIAWRETRSSLTKFLFVVFAVAIGVGALAGVRGFSESVRAMLNLLARKGLLTVRHEGKRYLYKPASSKEKVRRSVLKQLVRTFFSSDPADAVAALLDGSAGKLSAEDLDRIRQLIVKAEQDQSL